MEGDYTANSHYLTYTFISKKNWENVLFELVTERLVMIPSDSSYRIVFG